MTSDAKPISVSVSPFFVQLLEEYHFSPTEVFRVGMAVMLSEKGDIKYVNHLNKKRSVKAQETLLKLRNDEEALKFVSNIEATQLIMNNLKSIKKIIKSLE